MTEPSKGTPGNPAAECGSHSAASGLLGLPWYCINTHPGQADLAIRHINFQGFQTFYPVVRKVLPPSKKKRKPQFLPLFPNYLFVTFDVQRDLWHPLMYTDGVKHLFRWPNGPPIQLSESDMRLIVSQADDPNAKPPPLERVKLLRRPPPPDLAGQRVVIVDHPLLAGHEALVEWSTNDRVRLLMSMLNRDTAVILPRTKVSPVG